MQLSCIMCKESIHFSVKTRLPSPQTSPFKGEGVIGADRELLKRQGVINKGMGKEPCEEPEHHHHDDHLDKAHINEEKANAHQHDHSEHRHHLHDDIVSLAHRTHDHQHLPLTQNQAQVRAHSCHAGDGHDHGVSTTVVKSLGSMPIGRPMSGSSHQHHHEEGEHEHCPKCDEHLVDDKCSACGYEHAN